MKDTIYGKYFLPQPELKTPAGFGQIIASLDDDVMKGSCSYSIKWIPTAPEGIPGFQSWDQMSHGPHMHKNPELIIHIGTDPDNPLDLGGEVGFYMGKEMEKHTITKSTVVFIPANLIHCPWTIKRVNRPFIVMQVNQEPKHTEKSFPHLVPEDERKNMMFIDEGYESDEHLVQMPSWMGK